MIDAKTRLCAVIGNPIAHSLSPAMHNAAYKALGLNYAFLAFRVENVKRAIDAMRALNIRGYAVTVPHKENALEFVDSVDALAKKIGAINTIVNDEGRLKGYNTDASAAIASLKEKAELRNKKIALIGAGGAARAIAFGLKQEKADIMIFDKALLKARNLARLVDCKHAAIDTFEKILPKSEIIINATPIGMYPNIDESAIPAKYLTNKTVFDIVYNPIETKLLMEAEKRGCATINGVSMFVRQGMQQFKLFTGKEASFDVMLQAVKKNLVGK